MAKKLILTETKTLELMELLSKQRDELRGLRFSAMGGRPKDSAAPKKTRAMIARIMTELHVRKNNAASAPAEATV